MSKTFFEPAAEAESRRQWVVIDVSEKPVGRIASEIANILRGKHNPRFTPHNDCGDFVVVVNVEKIVFTGNKGHTKVYQHHTGYVGGIKSRKAGDLLAKRPEDVLRKAVQGMLPRTPLGRRQLKKLKVYTGAEHPHTAQQPEAYQL